MSGNVVVTGASSFVGCHLAVGFAAAGWRVSAVHTRPLNSYEDIRARRLRLVAGHAKLLQADLRDSDAAQKLADATSPTLWIQHAGYADNYASPDYQLGAAHEINVASLIPIYRALSGSGCGVIVTGSSAEYSISERANREDDACWPDTPYGLSKLTETILARQLALRYAVHTRIVRMYIPFGKYDNPRKLLPIAAAALAQSQPLDLSACEQKRDFIAIEDLVAGYLKLAADLPRATFDIFNLCRGETVKLKDLLTGLALAAGADPALFRFGKVPMRQGEADVSFGDATKARKLLGWQPRPLAVTVDLL